MRKEIKESNNIIINIMDKTIELSKQYAAAAKHYGTNEYKVVQAARRDNPDYQIIIKSAKKPKRKVDNFKGLTYGYMKTYIQTKHPDRMAEFTRLMESNDKDEKLSYFEIKDWFLGFYKEELSLTTNRRVEKRLMEVA